MQDVTLYKRLFDYLKPYRKRFIYGVLSSIPAAMLSGVLAFVIGPFVDKLLNTHNYNILMVIPLAIFLASATQGLFDYLSTYYTTYVGTAISQDFRLELYKQLGKMDFQYLRNSSQGDLFSRYYADPSRLQEAIVTNFQTFILEFFTFISLAGVLFYRSWSFALISIAIISLIVFPIQIISKKLRRLDHENQQILAKIYDVFYESIVGYKVVSIFGLQSHQGKRFQKALDDYFGNAMSLTRAGAALKPVLQMIAATGISIIVFIGSFQVQNKTLTPGELTSFLIALVLLYRPVKNISGILSKIQRIFAPAERVFEKLDLIPAVLESETALTVSHLESLQFDRVTFGYDTEKTVLKDIDFTLPVGQTLALVGESGGGKSTLVDLIARFMDPQQGAVRINGHDIREVSMTSLHKLVSLVSQDTVLFHGSIRENIRLGRLSATDAEIETVVDLANLRSVVNELSEGLDTVIGYRGVALSGGQKQRVAIARAFLKDAPLIILDEATSALDNESEAQLQEAMERIMAGKTVIVIAHRLSTIRNADRILVLDQGQIVESGTHTELLELQGIYSKLYYLQFRHDTSYMEHIRSLTTN